MYSASDEVQPPELRKKCGETEKVPRRRLDGRDSYQADTAETACARGDNLSLMDSINARYEKHGVRYIVSKTNI